MPSIAGLKPRPTRVGWSGRETFAWPDGLRERIEQARAEIAAPFVGITSDGQPEPGLFRLTPTGLSVRPIVEAAQAWLAALEAPQRTQAQFDVESSAWREWSNISPFLMRHGVLLEVLSEAQRELALTLVRQSVSQAAFATARDVMRLNHHIGELTGSWNEYGEWLYWLSIFGTPSASEPWGWQLDGHHLILNCLVLGDQLVLTPQFLGSEPVLAESGTYAGTRVFEREEDVGFQLMRSLSDAQQDVARIGMQLPFDAVATAPHDNLVMPYAGIPASRLSDVQRQKFFDVVDVFIGRWPAGHAELKRDEVVRHLEQTYFAWIGACDETSPFYYRVHSPVVLIEFDHQRGIALDNDEPTRNHIHTLVRTPNGNDYGKDLLRQHYAKHHASTSSA
jgi:Protein of unknown function (DUF3500)